MLTLYVKTGCPFCAKVLQKLQELGTPFEEKNIADSAVAQELIAEGGKRQVPFLDDDNMTPTIIDDDVLMYESNDIVSYLDNKFSGDGVGSVRNSPQNIRLHRDDGADVCESCQ